MIEGCEKGFQKKLVLVGVGYRAQLKGSDLETCSWAIPIRFWLKCPEGIKFEVPLPDRDRRLWSEQGAGWPGRCGDPQLA